MSMPAALAEVVSDFAEVEGQDKLQLLLEFAQELPALPGDLEEAAMEPVPECQSPLFVTAEVDDDRLVHLFVDVPREAPTTRGFAGIMLAGLDGLPADEVLAVPGDVTAQLGLAEVVSPLRLRGATALLSRIQRQVREQLAAA